MLMKFHKIWSNYQRPYFRSVTKVPRIRYNDISFFLFSGISDFFTILASLLNISKKMQVLIL